MSNGCPIASLDRRAGPGDSKTLLNGAFGLTMGALWQELRRTRNGHRRNSGLIRRQEQPQRTGGQTGASGRAGVGRPWKQRSRCAARSATVNGRLRLGALGARRADGVFFQTIEESRLRSASQSPAPHRPAEFLVECRRLHSSDRCHPLAVVTFDLLKKYIRSAPKSSVEQSDPVDGGACGIRR